MPRRQQNNQNRFCFVYFVAVYCRFAYYVAVQYEERHDKVIRTHPTVEFSRHRSFRLLRVPVDDTWPVEVLFISTRQIDRNKGNKCDQPFLHNYSVNFDERSENVELQLMPNSNQKVQDLMPETKKHRLTLSLALKTLDNMRSFNENRSFRSFPKNVVLVTHMIPPNRGHTILAPKMRFILAQSSFKCRNLHMTQYIAPTFY